MVDVGNFSIVFGADGDVSKCGVFGHASDGWKSCLFCACFCCLSVCYIYGKIWPTWQSLSAAAATTMTM